MSEITITTNKIMHTAETALNIWRWEVPVYLFLGGLTAGIMIFGAYMIIKNKGKGFALSTNKIMLSVPILISLGMFALFLDLSHKLYVWRFYTTFQVTSPMSWGSWILLLVYPFSIFLVLGTLREGYPSLNKWIEDKISNTKFLSKISSKLIELYKWVLDFTEKHKVFVAKMTIPVGILLGVYTGILLNTLVARPFWNSAILGPLFLVSGASTGAAFIILLSKEHEEKIFFTKIDLGLIATEIVLLILFLIGLKTSNIAAIEAANLVLGGILTPVFWIFIFIVGLSMPALFELMELKGIKINSAIAAIMVLVGGLVLRFIFVEAGQISSWLPY